MHPLCRTKTIVCSPFSYGKCVRTLKNERYKIIDEKILINGMVQISGIQEIAKTHLGEKYEC